MFTINFTQIPSGNTHADMQTAILAAQTAANAWILTNYDTYTVTTIHPPVYVNGCITITVNYVRQRD
jgi:hypothetical protein